MIDRSGTVKIIDFATTHVAGLTEGTLAAGVAAGITGTLQYTAPEYFVGGERSARSDLFSLAVLVYQMLTGRLPYGLQVSRLRAPSDLKQLRYVPLRHLRPELPAWLDRVLEKALQPNPAKRQEAVSEFMQDLQAPGPEFQRLAHTALVARHPIVFWQVTTLVLAVAVVLLIALRVLGR